MERQEPRFDKDIKDVEFRPRSYRGPSQRAPSHSSDGFAWKIGVAVGGGVLAALLIFNVYERYQARRDVEEAMRLLERESVKLEREMQAAVRTASAPTLRPAAVIHPVPPGYRCAGSTLLYREGDSWTQISARSSHVYCPHGRSVDACYPVTPRSVGCTR